jgi:predicted HTH domain antitoxin
MKNVEDILRRTAINTLGLLLERTSEEEVRSRIIQLQEYACEANRDEISRLADEVVELKKKLKG